MGLLVLVLVLVLVMSDGAVETACLYAVCPVCTQVTHNQDIHSVSQSVSRLSYGFSRAVFQLRCPVSSRISHLAQQHPPFRRALFLGEALGPSLARLGT